MSNGNAILGNEEGLYCIYVGFREDNPKVVEI